VFLKEGEYPWQMYMPDLNSAEDEARKSSLFVKDVRLIPREPETLKGVRHVVMANEKFHILASRKDFEAKIAAATKSPTYRFFTDHSG